MYATIAGSSRLGSSIVLCFPGTAWNLRPFSYKAVALVGGSRCGSGLWRFQWKGKALSCTATFRASRSPSLLNFAIKCVSNLNKAKSFQSYSIPSVASKLSLLKSIATLKYLTVLFPSCLYRRRKSRTTALALTQKNNITCLVVLTLQFR